jgi:hypothetical protein
MFGEVTSKVIFFGVISARLIGEEKKPQAVSRSTGSFWVNSNL